MSINTNNTVAVTGADGYLGNVLIKKLLQQGYTVRVLIHKHNTNLDDLNVIRINGDMRDKESLYSLCQSCKAVFHLASYISIVSHEDATLRSVNIEGTRNLIEVCMAEDIRLIYASSVEAIGKKGEYVHNEKDGFNEDKALIRYGWSKALASKEVLKACQNGLDAVIVSPTGIVGPFDNGSSMLGKMVKSFISSTLPSYPSNGGFCFVDVRDVADALIEAHSKAQTAAHYIVSSEYFDVAHMMDILEEVSGVTKPKFSIPLWLMYCVACFVEPVGKMLKRSPIFTKGSVNILQSRLKVESLYLQKDLQIVPRPLKETLNDQIRWYRGEDVAL